MEGSSSTVQAAAAALVKNFGVAEADVVPGGGSCLGAVASGGLVAAAVDQEEHGFGGATVPDRNVVPAGDTLVYLARFSIFYPLLWHGCLWLDERKKAMNPSVVIRVRF
jgi:hypothetical protein